MLFQTSLGIYIKDDSLSIVCLTTSFKGIQVAAQSVFSLDEEKPIKERLETVSGLVMKFMEENRVSSANINLGINRDLAIIRFIELPLAAKENLRETLGYEMEKYVPFSMEDVYFDYNITGEDKKTNTLGVVLVVVTKESLSPYIELKDHFSGGGISGIEINSTASANYFSRKNNNFAYDSLLLVNMANNELEINVIRKKVLIYSRFIKIPDAGADIYSLFSKELRHVKEAYGQMNISFLGPDSFIENLRNASKEANFEEYPVNISKTGILSYAFVPAYGLALKGIQKVPIDINLLPNDLRKKASKAGLYLMFTLVGLLLLSAVSWGVGDILQKRVALDKINNEINTLSADITKIEMVKEECKSLEDQINYLNSLGPGGLLALDVLKELSERIPENAWLRKFVLKGDKVEIDGHATSASELISLIEACSFFRDAAFLSPISKLRDGKEYFRIGFKLINKTAG